MIAECDILDFDVPAMSVDVMTKNAAGKKVVKLDAKGHPMSVEKVLPKERPRFFHTKGGKNIAYTTQKTMDFESWIRRSFFERYPGQGGVWHKGKPWPVHTTFIGCYKHHLNTQPCTHFRQCKDFLDCQVCDSRRKNLSLLVEVHIKDDRSMDLDNVIKIVLDALNNVCFYDDVQFCQKHVELIPYAAVEHLRVKIASVAPYMHKGSVVGCYSIKKMRVEDAKEYAKNLLEHLCMRKDIEDVVIIRREFFEFLQRCDGRRYVEELKKTFI